MKFFFFVSFHFVIAFIFGDPHLETVDRRAYDFHAVGEFILARVFDESSELLVVARMEINPPNVGNFTSITRVGVTFRTFLYPLY